MPLPDAARADLPVVFDEDISYTLTVKDENGDPIDLTNYTITSDVRVSAEDDADPLFSFTTTITDAVNGVFTLTAPAATVSAETLLPLLGSQRVGAFDIRFEAPSGAVRRWVHGSILFQRPVTRE